MFKHGKGRKRLNFHVTDKERDLIRLCQNLRMFQEIKKGSQVRAAYERPKHWFYGVVESVTSFSKVTYVTIRIERSAFKLKGGNLTFELGGPLKGWVETYKY